jgi:hypothetical protein
MLPRTITDEIFNLRYRVNDVALNHVYDELLKYGCLVTGTIDCDASIIIYFKRPNDATHPLLDGELRIDRIERTFEIAVKYGDTTVLPMLGAWELIDQYLNEVIRI